MSELSLFLHSTGTGPVMWMSVPETVWAGGEALMPSHVGYAPHPPVARGERTTVSDELALLLPQIPATATRIHLYAHSYGGLVALKLARELGPRLASLWLVEPVLFGALLTDEGAEPAALAEARSFKALPTFLTDEALGGNEAWLEGFIDYWNRPGSWARLPEPMREHQLSLGWKMFQEVRSVFFEVGAYEEVLPPNVPTTLVLGERTTLSAKAMVAALSKRLPHAVVETLPKAGHMAPVTQPEAVHASMQRHVERRRG